jgi:hypothetical protein
MASLTTPFRSPATMAAPARPTSRLVTNGTFSCQTHARIQRQQQQQVRRKSGPYGYTQAKSLVFSKFGEPKDVLRYVFPCLSIHLSVMPVFFSHPKLASCQISGLATSINWDNTKRLTRSFSSPSPPLLADYTRTPSLHHYRTTRSSYARSRRPSTRPTSTRSRVRTG